MIDEEIRAALDVDPSPEFVARVRTRIAAEGAPSAWRWSWGLAIATALAASATLMVIVSRPHTPPSTSVAGTSAAGSENRPASEGSTAKPGAAELDTKAGRAERTRVAVSRQARSRPIHTNALAGRMRSEPEILIDPREADALRRLIAGVREGRIDLTAAQPIASPAAAEIEPVARIVIPPITIEPIAPVPGAEGVRP
jgi:hypothetical protein